MRPQMLAPKDNELLQPGFAHLPFVGLSDHTGPLQISGCLSFGLLLFRFALEGQGLLELLRDVEGVEAPLGSDNRLEGNGYARIESAFRATV